MIRLLLFLSLIFGNGYLLAQNTVRQQLIDNAAVEYLKAAGSQSPLYSGKLQEGHQRVSNHPYLTDERYAKSRLSYSGVIYPEVLLRLDLSRDELVIQSPDYHNIVLLSENVDFAELHGQTIVYFNRDSLQGCPPSGYYIQLHSGKCKVLVRKSARLELKSSGYQHNYTCSTTTNYYLYKDEVYYTIRNKRELLKVLQLYRRELRQFISNANLQFRHDAAKFIQQTVGEYEKLSGAL